MMILLSKLAIKSEGTRLDNEITTKLLLSSIISFLTKNLYILCSDIFKWSSIGVGGTRPFSFLMATLTLQNAYLLLR